MRRMTVTLIAAIVALGGTSLASAAEPKAKKAPEAKPAAASNQAPDGWLETPAAKARVKGKAALRGAAFDQDGTVTKIEILLDGQPLRVSLKQGEPRLPACSKHQMKGCPNIGFSGEADLAKVEKGPHTLSLRLTDNSKKTVELGKREITVE